MAMTELEERAVDYLTKGNYKFNIDMIEPIKHKIAKVLYLKDDGLLIDADGYYMWTADTEKRALEITDIVAKEFSDENEACIHTKLGIDYAAEKLQVKWRQVPCYVAALFDHGPYKIDTELTFEKLDHSYDQLVKETYNFFKDDPDSLPYAAEAIDRGIFGGFLNGTCVGYIGTHSEGTMGMLEVFPPFRRNGYGRALEEYLMNYLMENGKVPFCHILENNTASLQLQSNMGLWLSGNDKVYWMGR